MSSSKKSFLNENFSNKVSSTSCMLWDSPEEVNCNILNANEYLSRL